MDPTPRNEKPMLDLGSTRIDTETAIKCLTGEYNVILPTPSVKPCNNLDEYLYRSTASSRKTPQAKGSHNRSLRSDRDNLRRLSQQHEPFAVPLVRNFEKILKKTELSPGTSQIQDQDNTLGKTKKVKSDVFTKVEAIEPKSGPLYHLKDHLNQKVRVMIRRRRNVPYISRVIEYKGTLTLFDKHMNLYLKDAIESFTYSSEGKTMKRARHRDGIIIRGDNVILIA